MHKLYYSISEVCQLVDEEQHILRYWEKEFPQLKPKKNRGGNRIYSQKDVALISTIKKLLREDKIPLKSAKKRLAEGEHEEFSADLFTEKSFERTIPAQIKRESGILDEKEKFYLSKDEAKELLDILRKFSDILRKN